MYLYCVDKKMLKGIENEQSEKAFIYFIGIKHDDSIC